MAMVEILGRDSLSGKTLRVIARDGLIARVDATSQESHFYLSPGFVDLQVNGFAGFDMNAADVSVDTVFGLVDAMLQRGVTCFAPTVITAAEEQICHALKTIAKARSLSGQTAACIPYVHMEGPHISPLWGYRGAHAAQEIRPPSIAEFDRWQQASGGVVGMVTLSPHHANTKEYIEHLVGCGVHVALGHTHASAAEIRRAVDAGARLSTHLGNGIPAQIARHPNVIWSQLAEPRLTASVIADGHHLPSEVLQVIANAKGVGSTVLVSDSVALAGLLPGMYQTPVGGTVELRADGRLCLPGTELLAGSTATLPQCVAHMVRRTTASLAEALTMATLNPGRFVGGRGRLEVGAKADIVRFRWDGEGEIEIVDVWLRGNRIDRLHV